MDGWVAPGTEHGVVAPVRPDPTGRRPPTRRQAAGPGWRRSSQGLYVPADVPLTPAQRVVEAGVLVPRAGAVTGWGALTWRTGGWFTGTRPDGSLVEVDLAVPAHRIRSRPGFHVTGDRFFPYEATNVDGIWVALAVVAAFFEMRYAASVRQAAAVLAMAAYDDLVSVAEMEEHALAHPAYTGVPQCRDALPLVSENCWSPQEQRMLSVWELDAALPRPLVNQPLFDLRGHHIGTPDLVDVRAGVLGQYDGGLHLVGDAPERDATRDSVYARHGLETVTARAGDLGGGFVAALRSAYARAARRPQADRTWTADLPSWWVPTFTVEQRRALCAEDRERWLRYRAVA